MEERDELAPYLSAYAAGEPRRRRSPFGDPRLAEIAAARAARAATPWYRRLLLVHPAPAFASGALALLLLVAPDAAPSSPFATERMTAPASSEAAGDLLATPLASPVVKAELPGAAGAGADPLPLLLAAAAAASTLEGIRRLRAYRG